MKNTLTSIQYKTNRKRSKKIEIRVLELEKGKRELEKGQKELEKGQRELKKILNL
jgi:hypothetical protein